MGSRILLVTVLASTAFILLAAASAHAAAVFQPGLFKNPMPGYPVFVKPGGSFTVEFSKPLQVSRAVIADGTHTYTLRLRGSGEEYTATVPADAAPGLYDLIVYTKAGAYGVPNAVYVYREEPGEVRIIHVTDTHIGVIDANGRSGASYTLAAFTMANSMNATIVAATGDIADTATPQQYMEFVRLVELLREPLLAVPGNHDHVQEGVYNQYVSPLHWAKKVWFIGFLGIDSGYEGYIDTTQAEWAYRELCGMKTPFKIVMFHHPLFSYVWLEKPFIVSSWKQLLSILEEKKPGSRYPYVYTSWLSDKQALAVLVKALYQCNASLVLTGHIHLDSYARVVRKGDGSITFIVTTATGGPVRPHDYHGYRLIIVTRTGAMKVLGDGEPWVRHASFNLEKVYAVQVSTKYARSTVIVFNDTKAEKYMKSLVVAVLAPPTWSKYPVSAPGATRIEKLCTPLACRVYAYYPPRPGVYHATIYTKPDKQPPSIELESMQPSHPYVGDSVTLQLRVTDDSWGVALIHAELEAGGKKLRLYPAVSGSTVMLTLPPIKAGEAVVKVTAIDASGKKTTKTITIHYAKPQQATTTTTATRTTTTTTPAATTTTTTTTTTTITPVKPHITVTLPKIATPTATPAAPAPSPAALVVIAAAVIAVAVAAAAAAALGRRR